MLIQNFFRKAFNTGSAVDTKQTASTIVNALSHSTRMKGVLRRISETDLRRLLQLCAQELESREILESEKRAHEESMAKAAEELMTGTADPALKDVFDRVLKTHK